VKEGVSIGNGSLVGMGSVVLQDVSPDMVVAGVPAKVLRHIE
jgi:acetyltransferase-like isoleucine patch superfamily enzyme